MKVTLIKYNAGNTGSVTAALNRLGVAPVISDDPETIISSDKVILPGVGEAGSAMNCLKEKNLVEVIRNLKQPVLGICLGMQLMCSFSEEGNTDGLSIFEEKVKLFPKLAKIPHVGWNSVCNLITPLFEGIRENEYFYFVHSFYAEKGKSSISETDYILNFASALQKKNFYGVQFHPEKSGVTGSRLLSNFLNL